jgi:hypothetical protein
MKDKQFCIVVDSQKNTGARGIPLTAASLCCVVRGICSIVARSGRMHAVSGKILFVMIRNPEHGRAYFQANPVRIRFD